MYACVCELYDSGYKGVVGWWLLCPSLASHGGWPVSLPPSKRLQRAVLATLHSLVGDEQLHRQGLSCPCTREYATASTFLAEQDRGPTLNLNPARTEAAHRTPLSTAPEHAGVQGSHGP